MSLSSDREIERQTALTWADRAIESYGWYGDTRDVHWIVRAELFAHEALEHAADVRDYGVTVGKLQREIEAASSAVGFTRAMDEIGGLHMLGAY